MKRTSIVVLLVVALAGAAAGFLLDHALTAGGRPTFTPSLGLPVLLVLLGAGAIVLAWPIRRSARGAAEGSRRPDPFRAFRIAMLARASSILGAAVAGFAAGLGAYLLGRPIAPPVVSITAILVTVIAGLVLVAAALVVESFCTLPHDPGAPPGASGTEDDDDQHSRAAAPHGH